MNDSKRTQLTLEGFMKFQKMKHEKDGSSKEILKSGNNSSYIFECCPNLGKKRKKDRDQDVGSRKIKEYRNLLINLKNYPDLYDKSSAHYDDNTVRDVMWTRLAIETNTKKETLKRQFRRLIKKYGAEREKENSDWNLIEETRFLESYFVESSTSSSEDTKDSSSCNYIDWSSNNSSDQQIQLRSSGPKRPRVIKDEEDEDEGQEVTSSDQNEGNLGNDVISLDTDYEEDTDGFRNLPSPPRDQPQLLQLSQQSTEEDIIIHSNVILEPKQETSFTEETEPFQEPPPLDENANLEYDVSTTSFNPCQPLGSSTQIQQDNQNEDQINKSFCDYLEKELNRLSSPVAHEIRWKISQMIFECDRNLMME